MLQDLLFEQALAEYSAGMAPETVASSMHRSVAVLFPEMVALFPQGQDFEVARPSYVKVHRLIAGLVLTKTTPEEAKRIFDALDSFDLDSGEYGGYDQIWCACLQHYGLTAKAPQTDIHWPAADQHLWTAIKPNEAPIRKADAFGRFFEGWYDAMSPELMAQTARADELGDTSQFVGYWCLEAAAASVAFDIDDSGARDHTHYPKDWADWARGGRYRAKAFK